MLLIGIPLSVFWYVYSHQHEILEAQLQKLFRSPTSYEHAHIEWKDFPWVDISLTNLHVKGTPTDSVTEVVFANKISVRLPVWDIYQKAEYIQIPKMEMDSLWVSLYMDKNRAKNFKLFGTYNPNKKGPREIDFQKVSAKKVSLRYVYSNDGRDYLFHWNKMETSLQLHKHDMNILLDVEGKTVRFKEKKTTFLEEIPMKVHLKGKIGKADKRATFEDFSLHLAEMPFILKGNMLLGEERDYHIGLNAPDIQLQKFATLLPKDMQNKLKVYAVDGSIALNGGIEGTYRPQWNVAFNCQHAKIKNVIKNTSLDSLKLKGLFTNGEKQAKSSYLLQVDTLSGKIAGSSFLAGFQIRDFEQFMINGFVKTDVALSPLTHWLNWKKTASGRLTADVQVAGQVQDLAAFNMEKLRIKGFFQLDTTGIQLPGNHFENLNARVTFKGREAVLNPSFLFWNQQEIRLDAKFSTDVLGWPAKLAGQANVHFNSLDLSKLQNKNSEANKKSEFGFNPYFTLPAWLALRLKLSADNVHLGKLVVKEFVSDWELDNQMVQLHDLQLRNTQDTLRIIGHIDTRDSSAHWLEASVLAHSPNWRNSISTFGLLDPDTTRKNSFLGNAYARIRARIGKPENKQFPKIKGLIEVIDTQIEDKKYQLALTNLNLDIPFTEQNFLEPTLAPIRANRIHGFLDNQPFKGDILIESLKSQRTFLNLWMEICVEQFLVHLPVPGVSDVSGKIRFDLDMSGKYSNMLKLDSAVYVSSKGRVEVENVAFVLQPSGLQYQNISGNLEYNDEFVKTDGITGNFEGTDFKLKGKSKEVLAYLFLKGTKLTGNFDLEMDTLFLAPLLGDTTKAKSNKVKNYDIKIPQNTEVEGIVRAGTIEFERLALRNSVVNACMIQGQIFFDQLQSDFCSGQAQANGWIDARDSSEFTFAARMNLDSVNVSRLLFSVKNFNQELLTHDKVEGRIKASAEMSMKMPKNLITDYSSLRGTAQFTIDNGELNQFSPLQKLKPIVKKEYLEESRFEMHCDSVSVQNRKIFVHAFEIRSNIANMIISGIHTLDQEYQYKLQIQRLKRKLSKRQIREFEGRGKVHRKKEDYQNTWLRFKIIGKGKNYKILYDFNGLWEMIKNGFTWKKKKKEKRN